MIGVLVLISMALVWLGIGLFTHWYECKYNNKMDTIVEEAKGMERFMTIAGGPLKFYVWLIFLPIAIINKAGEYVEDKE